MVAHNYTLAAITICFTIAHFFGDWILQSRYMARNKSSMVSVLFKHLMIVTTVLTVPVFFFCPQKWWALLVNAVIHGIIDWNIWKKYKAKVFNIVSGNMRAFEKYKYWEDKRFYDTIAVDQTLHLVTLFFLFL